MSALSFSALTSSATRAPLDQARSDLEDLGGAAPTGVDAGILTPTIQAMVGRLLGEVATVAATMSHLSAEVSATAADLHQTDAAQSDSFRPGRLR